MLQRLQASGAELPALRAAARGHGRLLELGAASAPVVRIEGDWDSWSAKLSSRRRQDYRRARRRLQERGAARYRAEFAPARLQERFVALLGLAR